MTENTLENGVHQYAFWGTHMMGFLTYFALCSILELVYITLTSNYHILIFTTAFYLAAISISIIGCFVYLYYQKPKNWYFALPFLVVCSVYCFMFIQAIAGGFFGILPGHIVSMAVFISWSVAVFSLTIPETVPCKHHFKRFAILVTAASILVFLMGVFTSVSFFALSFVSAAMVFSLGIVLLIVYRLDLEKSDEC